MLEWGISRVWTKTILFQFSIFDYKFEKQAQEYGFAAEGGVERAGTEAGTGRGRPQGGQTSEKY